MKIQTQLCSRCGSELKEMKKSTQLQGKSTSPITVTIFKCTDKVCQAASDKRVADFKQQLLEREEKKLARLQANAKA